MRCLICERIFSHPSAESKKVQKCSKCRTGRQRAQIGRYGK